MNEREADLIAARAHLKTMCDPRGWGLIDALVDAALSEHRLSAQVVAVEPDGGYLVAGNGHHSRRVDLWRADA